MMAMAMGMEKEWDAFSSDGSVQIRKEPVGVVADVNEVYEEEEFGDVCQTDHSNGSVTSLFTTSAAASAEMRIEAGHMNDHEVP